MGNKGSKKTKGGKDGGNVTKPSENTTGNTDKPGEKEDNQRTVTLKVFIIGDYGVGKTSLALRFVKDSFDEELSKSQNQIPHAELDVMSGAERLMPVNDAYTAKIVHFDTGGNEKFRDQTVSPFAKANLVFICFAINNSESFNQLRQYWYNEALKYTKEKKPLFVLVGTKQDLNQDRRISQEEAEKWAKAQNPPLLYFEVSAKSGHNVKELYSNACKELVRKVEDKSIPNPFESEEQ